VRIFIKPRWFFYKLRLAAIELKTLLTISAFLIVLHSCTDRQKQHRFNKLFDVTYHLLSVDTNIRGTQYHNGYYLLQLDNNNFAVLDTTFKRHKEIEQLLADTKTTLFHRRGDTTILTLETKNFRAKEFYLTNDFKLLPLTSKPSHEKPVFYGQVLLEDSTYQIYGCCVGEFGGSLFFYNKHNKRLYFYNSECVYQVVYFHNSYYVFENLYTDDYTRISNPEKLIELKYKDRLFGCNWWTEVDSLNSYEKSRHQKIEGLVEYKPNLKERSLNSFVYNDTLFTIVSTDSSTYLAIHQGDSLKKVQKLLDKKLWFHHTGYYDDSGRRIISFSATSTQWNSDTKAATDMANSGFVIIQGRKIDIAEYPKKRDYIMK
jgi:hypothetical protein